MEQKCELVKNDDEEKEEDEAQVCGSAVPERLWNEDLGERRSFPEGVVSGTMIEKAALEQTLQLLAFAADTGHFPQDDAHWQTVLADRVSGLLRACEIPPVAAYLAHNPALVALVRVSVRPENELVLGRVLAVAAVCAPFCFSRHLDVVALARTFFFLAPDPRRLQHVLAVLNGVPRCWRVEVLKLAADPDFLQRLVFVLTNSLCDALVHAAWSFTSRLVHDLPVAGLLALMSLLSSLDPDVLRCSCLSAREFARFFVACHRRRSPSVSVASLFSEDQVRTFQEVLTDSLGPRDSDVQAFATLF